MTDAERAEAQEEAHAIVIDPQAELLRALVKARQAVKGTLYKAGAKTEGGGGSYKYVGHEHVVEHVRDRMLDNGLVLLETHLAFVAAEATKSGNVYRWQASFCLHHVMGGQLAFSYECMTAQSDKASFIASTALDRTALLRIMGVAGTSDEDPEHNSNNRETTASNAPRERITLHAAQRNERQTTESAEQALVAKHVTKLPKLQELNDLVDWAAWLKEGWTQEPGPQMFQVPHRDKVAAWNEYGMRCQAVGIDPDDTTKLFNIQASKLKAERAG